MNDSVFLLPNGVEFTRDPADAAQAWATEAWRLRDAIAAMTENTLARGDGLTAADLFEIWPNDET